MRILALDHGSKRIGVAVSDETKTIAQPLEFIPAEPFADFLARFKQLLREKEMDLILIGLPRNMDGSYGPAAEKVQTFVAVLKNAIAIPIKTWDERLTSAQANRVLIQGGSAAPSARKRWTKWRRQSCCRVTWMAALIFNRGWTRINTDGANLKGARHSVRAEVCSRENGGQRTARPTGKSMFHPCPSVFIRG